MGPALALIELPTARVVRTWSYLSLYKIFESYWLVSVDLCQIFSLLVKRQPWGSFLPMDLGTVFDVEVVYASDEQV